MKTLTILLALNFALLAAEPVRLRIDEEIGARLETAGVQGRNCRVVQLDAAAPVNNIRVIHFGRANDLGQVPLKLNPWDVRWIEVE
jgi:hypothetical protein